MSRPEFKTREFYIGDGILQQYTFDFKIVNANHLKVIKIDDQGEVVWMVRADDTTYFTTVLNSDDGEITLVDPLEEDYKLILLLADDEPVQGSKYTTDPRFTMAKLEGSFDNLSGQIQRMRFLLDRSIVLSDTFTDDFDMTMPDPVASAIVAVNDDGDGLQLIPIAAITTIMSRLDTAENDIDALEARMTTAEGDIDALEARMTTAEGEIDTLQGQVNNIENLADQAADDAAAAQLSAAEAADDAAAAQLSAAEAAADAAAAVGASVSNRIQVIPYAPAFMGAIIDEEYDMQVCKLDVGNRLIAFVKMSEYFITGRPIKVGFAAYTPTNNLTSKYQLQMTATLVKDGMEVTTVVNQEVITEEVTVSAVASALKVFSFEISPIGEINGVEVDANDGIKLEFKRIDASSNEDVELTRLLNQTFELSFA